MKPGLRIRIHLIRIRHFRLNTDPDPIRIQRFDDKKLDKIYRWKKKFFWINDYGTIYLSLGLHKGRPIYRRSLQVSKESNLHFKIWNFFIFFYFCGSFCPPGSGYGFPIRIRVHWPDWIRIRNPVWNRSELECTDDPPIYVNHSGIYENPENCRG